jgi:hypothetical protein
MEGVDLAERISVGWAAFVEYALRELAPIIFVVAAGMFVSRKMRSKEAFLLLSLFVVQVGYSVYVGGDYAEPVNAKPQVDAANRFITQGMPGLFVLFSISAHKLLTLFIGKGQNVSTIARGISTRAAIILGIFALVIVNGEVWTKWGIYNAPLLQSDIQRALRGIHIRRSTDSEAIVAMHAAGNIGYFSHRRAIDLLGKSDRVIARSKPRTRFRPGHNKWDYDYSIGNIQPDLIADEWGRLRQYLSSESSYVRMGNGIHVRKNSELVDRVRIGENFRSD